MSNFYIDDDSEVWQVGCGINNICFGEGGAGWLCSYWIIIPLQSL